MLITMKKLVEEAKKQKFAIPAPTVWSMETTLAAYEVAREMKAPLVLMVWDDGPEWIERMGKVVRMVDQEFPDVACALILDHGQSFVSAMAAIHAGYTTVMADFSMKPFAENVAEVKRIVDAAHAVNVSVEAELGHVGEGAEYEKTRDAGLTNPDEASAYIEQTGCDMLAVAVGTSHGNYKGEPRIDFERLQKLNDILDIPLVLHGGSGTGEENLRNAIHIGIQKVNLCTDLFYGYEKAVRKAAAAENPRFLSMYLAGAEGYKDTLRYYVTLFEADNKMELFMDYLAKPEEVYYDWSNDSFKLTL